MLSCCKSANGGYASIETTTGPGSNNSSSVNPGMGIQDGGETGTLTQRKDGSSRCWEKAKIHSKGIAMVLGGAAVIALISYMIYAVQEDGDTSSDSFFGNYTKV